MRRFIFYTLLALLLGFGGCRQKALTPGKLNLVSASPTTFSNDHDVLVTIRGEGFTRDTSFFIQSNKLEVKQVTPQEAKVLVPSGFLPATYGLMATRPDGQRSVLYPAFTITQGKVESADPFQHPRSFVVGTVIDYDTKEPLVGARVSAVGLHAVTDVNGNFLLWGVPPGRISVRIETEGYEPVYRFAEVSDGPGTVHVKLVELKKADSHVTVIGPEGGVHHANDGAYLVVPEGALSQEIPIRFTYLPGPNTLPELAEDGYYLAFAHLEPAGLVFRKPATLFLPLPPGVVLEPGTDINIFYFDVRQGRWVDDVTSGKIQKINGKYYLVYQINHFTWIGGTWYADDVWGCVDIGPERLPAEGIATNFGVTDANGRVFGSTTRSMVGRELILRAYYRGRTFASEPVEYYGAGDVIFDECIHLQGEGDPEPFANLGLDARDGDSCSSGQSQRASRYAVTPQISGSDSEQDSGLPPVPEQLVSLSSYVLADKFFAIDPSSVQVTVNGVDLSDRLVYDSANAGPITYYALHWTLDRGVIDGSRDTNTIEISYTTIDGRTHSHSAEVSLPAAYVVAPILFFPVRHDEDAWLGVDSTLLDDLPAVSFSRGVVTVVYEEGQPIHDLQLLLPVYALKSTSGPFELADVNVSSVYLTYGPNDEAVSGVGNMKGGLALLPVTIDTDDPKNYKFRFSALRVQQQSGVSGSVQPQGAGTYIAYVEPVREVLLDPPTRAMLVEILGPAALVVVAAVIVAEYGPEGEVLKSDYHDWADPYVRFITDTSNDIDRLINEMIASGDLVLNPVNEPDSTCWDQINTLDYLTNTHAGEQVQVVSVAETEEYLDKCTPKPEFRSGQRPPQDHFVYDQRTPVEQRALRNRASSAITKRWLKEIELVCRFKRGTRKWSADDIEAFIEAARAYRAAPNHTQGVKKAFEVLRREGLYGRNGRYVGHHINGKACHEAEAGNVNNIELIRSADHLFCHGGDYRQCSKGDTLKSFDEIADELKRKAGFDDIANCPTFNF